MKPKEMKTSRLEARLPAGVHKILRQAAAIQGRSLSDFVVVAAREAAEKAISEHNLIRLSLEDQKKFAAQLLNPIAVAPALKRAASRHRKLVDPT